jgi:hypothetical protein
MNDELHVSIEMIFMALLADSILRRGIGARGVGVFFSDRAQSYQSLNYLVDKIKSINTEQKFIDFMRSRVNCACLGVEPTISRKCSNCEISSSDLDIKSCGKDELKRCSRCQESRYCSAPCQRTHWKNGHKNQCSA